MCVFIQNDLFQFSKAGLDDISINPLVISCIDPMALCIQGCVLRTSVHYALQLTQQTGPTQTLTLVLGSSVQSC